MSRVLHHVGLLCCICALLACPQAVDPNLDTGYVDPYDATQDGEQDPSLGDSDGDSSEGDVPTDVADGGEDEPAEDVHEAGEVDGAPDAPSEDVASDASDGLDTDEVDDTADLSADPDAPSDSPDGDLEDADDTGDEEPGTGCPNLVVEPPEEECDDGETFPNDGCSPSCIVEDGWSCLDSPSICMELVLAPAVDGERSAGHSRPTWTWAEPDGTSGFRYRIGEGEWTEVDKSVLTYTAELDLDPGEHTFEVQASNAQLAWSLSAPFTTTVRYFGPDEGPWRGTSRAVTTTALGQLAGVVCRDCYATEDTVAASILETRRALSAANSGGADVIELPIYSSAGTLLVGDGPVVGEPAPLAQVLALEGLTNFDSLLMLRVHSANVDEGLLRSLLDLLNGKPRRYAKNGRPLVLALAASQAGAFDTLDTLLAGDDYPFLAHYVRRWADHRDSPWTTVSSAQSDIDNYVAAGLDGVWLPVTQRDLFAPLNYAHDLGLAVGLELVDFPYAFVAALREDADALLLEPNQVGQAVDLVSDGDRLLYMHPWDTSADVASVPFFLAGETTQTAAVGGVNQPRWATGGPGDPLFGSHLVFNKDAQESLLVDLGDPGAGVLIAAVVSFDDLDGIGSDTRTLAGRGVGAWTLELTNTVIRFGVDSDASWAFGGVASSILREGRSYFIIGTYGGTGDVRFWLDGAGDAGSIVSWGEAVLPLSDNGLPTGLGADAESEEAAVDEFVGRIQMLHVQPWSNID